MLAALLLLAMQGAPSGQEAASLPMSIAPGELAACAPTTIVQAEDCLRAALSSDDLKVVEDRIPARRFRPDLDKEITKAWRLEDSTSPMGHEMDQLLGLHAADIAAGMIVSDLQARAAGQPIDFAVIAEMFRKTPPASSAPGVPTTYVVPSREKN